jgi:hypothetical protein
VFRVWIGGEWAAGVGTLQLPQTSDEVALGECARNHFRRRLQVALGLFEMSTSDSSAIDLGGHLWKNRMNQCSISPNKRPRFGLLEEPRSEILQIATPGLPLMVGAR